MKFKVIYIMGVSGSGKTTIGEQLSRRTGYAFYDADGFHSAEAKAKMNAGIPLTDEDRWPWLRKIHDFVVGEIVSGNIILVCSALKQAYRDQLSKDIEENCRWVFLQGDYDTIFPRISSRKGHYMPATLLKSQFEALEIPVGAIQVDILREPRLIIDDIVAQIAG
jgi:carbohydrate kinase (thermoresistant glucokinase family)